MPTPRQHMNRRPSTTILTRTRRTTSSILINPRQRLTLSTHSQISLVNLSSLLSHDLKGPRMPRLTHHSRPNRNSPHLNRQCIKIGPIRLMRISNLSTRSTRKYLTYHSSMLQHSITHMFHYTREYRTALNHGSRLLPRTINSSMSTSSLLINIKTMNVHNIRRDSTRFSHRIRNYTSLLKINVNHSMHPQRQRTTRTSNTSLGTTRKASKGTREAPTSLEVYTGQSHYSYNDN